MALKGNEGFRYDPGGGTVDFFLNFPLWWKRPGRYKRRWQSWNLDGDKREVLEVVSSPLEEMWVFVRFESAPTELLAMLDAGADGVQLDYYPDMGLGTSYPLELVEPTDDTLALIRDRSQRGAIGEYEIAMRLRRTDGGNLDALF